MRTAITCAISVLLLCIYYFATNLHDEETPAVVNTKRVTTDYSCLQTAPIIIIVQELATRGITKWGCTEIGVSTGTWRPPTTGSPVVMYAIELNYYGASTDTFFTWPIPAFSDSVRARVAGIDALGRIGEWSQWSLWYDLHEGF